MGGIFTLSLCHVPACQYLLEGSFTRGLPWFLQLAPQYLQLLTRDTPWSPGSVDQEGLHSWILWNSGNWRDRPWQAATPIAFCRQQMKHIPHSVCEGVLLTHSEASVRGTDFRFGTHLMDYRVAFKKGRLWMPSWPLLQLAGVSQKSAIYSSGTCFCKYHSRNNARFPGKQGLYLWMQRTLYISIGLKAALWGSGFQAAWI